MSYDLTRAAERAAEFLRAYATDARRAVGEDGLTDRDLDAYVRSLAAKLDAQASALEHAAAPARRSLSEIVERSRETLERRPSPTGTDRLHKDRP